MAGKTRLLDDGAWAPGGRVPYGYERVFRNGRDKRDSYTLTPHAEDGPRFKSLMGWFVEGGVSHAAREAKAKGWLAPRGGSKWYPSTVQQIIKNMRVYLGEKTLTNDGQSYEVTYPALIDMRLYAKVERRKKERTLKRRTTLLGTGYCDCACGRHVHGHRSSTADHFHVRCREGCGSMREDVFTPKLWELVVARVIQIKESELQAWGKDPFTPMTIEAKAKLAKVQERLDRIVELYGEGEMDKAAYAKNNAKLRGQKVTIQEQLDRINADRAEHTQKRLGTKSVKSRVQTVLKRLKAGSVPLDGRRQILSDILQGERVIVTWSQNSLTLPAFGSLPIVTVRIDRDVTTQIHGISREVLDLYYDADAVTDVSL